MKHTHFLFLLLVPFVFSCNDDENDIGGTIEKGQIIDTVFYEGFERSYLVYVPQGYDGKEPIPMWLNFHPSLTFDSILYTHVEFTGFGELSEMENFILVSPKAGKDTGGTLRWNVDKEPELPDDISFVNHLIDIVSSKYNVDEERIYATGYSSGAFMSFALACDLSERIAAIAGSAGYLGASYVPNPPYNGVCNPSRPIAVLQIHGNLDPTVPYVGVQPSLNVWIEHNNTSTTPTVDTIDMNPSDGQWVEQFLYPDGEQGCEVEHLKIYGANHNYSNYDGSKEIKDIEEFWKFISQFDIHGKR